MRTHQKMLSSLILDSIFLFIHFDKNSKIIEKHKIMLLTPGNKHFIRLSFRFFARFTKDIY